MRALLGLIRKEFIQVFRDTNMLRLIFLVPIIQLFLFGYVANLDVKRIDIDVYDFDHTPNSRELVNAMKAGDYFIPSYPAETVLDAETRFRNGKAEMALVIPNDFSKQLQVSHRATIGLLVDGANSNTAAIGSGYAAQIAAQVSRRMLNTSLPLDIHYQVLYNPEAESRYFMVPGIVAALLTMVTSMLTSMAIVRERERGTLEQIMVTPISTTTLLLGKTIPFAILGLVELVLALGFGIIWFEVPFVGSPWLLLILSALYLLTTLGMGLFFSTITSTQQQAMFFAWFFFVFALLTSGLFTPVSNMPQWMQYLTYVNPMRFFLNITRGIMMRGAGVGELLSDIYVLIIFGLAIFGFSALRFSKRLT